MVETLTAADVAKFKELLPTLPDEVVDVVLAQALAASALGDDATAVFDFAELVYGIKLPKHAREWVTAFFEHVRTYHISPPESAKTTTGAVILAWWIGKHPETTNMVLSNGEDVASDIAQLVADTIEFNPRWKLVFPNVVPDKAKGWSRDGYFVQDTSKNADEWSKLTATRKDPSLMFGGVGSSSVNGRRVTGVLVLDDIHDRKSKDSQAECDRVTGFVRDTALRRATVTARVWGNQTRWNPNDVIGWIESLDGEYRFKVFHHPALTETGESYWPEQWPAARLQTERSGMTEQEWRLIFMGDATAAQGTVLKLEALRTFPFVMIKQEWLRYAGVDMALKMSELSAADERKHSEMAIAIMVYNGQTLVLEDGFAGMLYYGEAENTFFQLCDLHRPVRVGFEVNAQNRLYYNNFLRRKIEQGYAWLAIAPITTARNMATRMAEMEPDFRNGAIQVSDRPLPFLTKFRSQWVGFGSAGTKNDVLSAVHLARQAAYNLLPRENPEARIVRQSRKKKMSAFAQIENAYG